LRVDMIRGMPSSGLCLDIICKQMIIEQSMLLQQSCDVFGVLDEPFRSQY
jgi:hypothetical protein